MQRYSLPTKAPDITKTETLTIAINAAWCPIRRDSVSPTEGRSRERGCVLRLHFARERILVPTRPAQSSRSVAYA